MNKRLTQDALIAPLLKDFDFSTNDPELRKQFEEKYRVRLQEMWDSFLFDIAVERATKTHPLLQTKLNDTPLSSRAKKCLEALDVKTVADIAIFTLPELAMIRNMGKATLMEIEDYMKGVIGTK